MSKKLNDSWWEDLSGHMSDAEITDLEDSDDSEDMENTAVANIPGIYIPPKNKSANAGAVKSILIILAFLIVICIIVAGALLLWDKYGKMGWIFPVESTSLICEPSAWVRQECIPNNSESKCGLGMQKSIRAEACGESAEINDTCNIPCNTNSDNSGNPNAVSVNGNPNVMPTNGSANVSSGSTDAPNTPNTQCTPSPWIYDKCSPNNHICGEGSRVVHRNESCGGTQSYSEYCYADCPTSTNMFSNRIEQKCWEGCGEPDFFYFKDSYARFGSVASCTVPSSCGICSVPDDLRPMRPADMNNPTTPAEYDYVELSQDPSIPDPNVAMCGVYSCNGKNASNYGQGTLNWCYTCANNCSGYQSGCIRDGFCQYNTKCASLEMCKPWRKKNCRHLNPNGTYTCEVSTTD